VILMLLNHAQSFWLFQLVWWGHLVGNPLWLLGLLLVLILCLPCCP
jgi:hypothetical protein